MLIAKQGQLPLTPKVLTGGGGFHYWLKFPAGTKCCKVAEGIDLKADGGYVIVPPSRILIPEHQGRAYAWADGCKPWEGVAIAEAPALLLSVKPKATAKASAQAIESPWAIQEACPDLLTHQGSPKGERRKTLCQLVGVHLARGDSEASIMALAKAWAERCTPGFEEWQKHTDGLMAKEEAKGLRMTTLSILPSPEPANYLTNSASADGDRSLLVSSQPLADGEAQAELIPSLPVAESEAGQGEACEVLSAETPSAQAAFPTLSREAYQGLFGEMLQAISPQTEADPAGVLLGWLCCFGSIVGRGAWVHACDEHHPALYVGIVGPTSARKGVGYGVAKWPFAKVEPEWEKKAVSNGIGSGQGMIERLKDEQVTMNKTTGEAKIIPAAEEKRCLFRLDELSICFKQQRQDGSILGDLLMTAWSGERLTLPNRADNALSASDYAISLIGDTQPGTLAKLLACNKATEEVSGWMNRFLWAVVRRQRNIPRPPKLDYLYFPFLDRLQSALAMAKSAGEVAFSDEAEALWVSVYDELSVSADSVPHTNRAEGYVTRLSLLYALADSSKVIRLAHLQAALSVWEYCRASAKLIFGGQQTAEPEPLWLQVLNAITKAPGINRSELLRAFRSVSADELDGLLASLEAKGLAYKRMVQHEGGGRPAERWYPGRKPDGDGNGDGNDNTSPPLSDSPWVVQAVAETLGRKEITPALVDDGESVGKERKEGNNSADTLSYFLPQSREGNNSALPDAQGVVNSFLPALSAQSGEAGVNSFLPMPGAEPDGEGSYFLPSGAEQEASVTGNPVTASVIALPITESVEGEEVWSVVIQKEERGTNMTMAEFAAECLRQLGPWNKPSPLGRNRPSWRSQEDQWRWYKKVKDAEAKRRERELEADELPEEDAQALLQSL
jgi:hypothetical protein